MIINHNISALNTHRQLGANNNAVQNSLEKLSSGLGINKAGDDAAGLAISEKMRGQIRGLEMAEKNAQDGISLIQTAEGALNETHDILQRMRELAVQSANDSNTDSDRAELQEEVNQLISALDDIANDTEFNTKKLLNGEFSGTFHVGANESQTLDLSVSAMGAAALGLTSTTTVESKGLESGATIKDGTYTVDENDDVKDASGNIIGTIDGEDLKLGDSQTTVQVSFTNTPTEGSVITIADGKAELKQQIDGTLRSEEHTSELQSRGHLVCRLLLEKKNKNNMN